MKLKSHIIIILQKFYNLRRTNSADWLSRAGIFKKWTHI